MISAQQISGIGQWEGIPCEGWSDRAASAQIQLSVAARGVFEPKVALLFFSGHSHVHPS